MEEFHDFGLAFFLDKIILVIRGQAHTQFKKRPFWVVNAMVDPLL